MTTAISIRTPDCLAHVQQWVRQNPKLAAITAVAFAALGIGSAVGSSILFASVSMAVVLGIAAALSLSVAAFLSYSSIRQIFLNGDQKEGTPPNIPISDVAAQKNYRVQVMNDTIRCLRSGHYTAPNGTQHPLDLRRAASGAQLLLNAGPVSQRPGTDPLHLIVKNQDCLYAAQDLHNRGLSPIVLDLASDGHFGGGYMGGARAQEEDCCRRSGLCFAADTQHGLQTRNFYPLSSHSPSAGIYVPHVPIFRGDYNTSYQYLNQPFEAAFGIIAAFNNPPLDNSTGRPRLRPAEANITREKIRTFFEMARQKGHQSVVFGALGCGAFRNPPDHIAEIAIDVIQREFANCFKEVVIAVRDDHNTGHAHNPEGNFLPFARKALASGGRAFDANGQELTSI